MWKDPGPPQSLDFVANLSQQDCDRSHFPVCLELEMQQELTVEKAVSSPTSPSVSESDFSSAIVFPRAWSSLVLGNAAG